MHSRKRRGQCRTGSLPRNGRPQEPAAFNGRYVKSFAPSSWSKPAHTKKLIDLAAQISPTGSEGRRILSRPKAPPVRPPRERAPPRTKPPPHLAQQRARIVGHL